jgi:mycothiol synthase
MSQLHMRRADLQNLPPLQLPEGYVLREYSKGDENGIATLLQTTFGDVWTTERVQRELTEADDVKQTFVIECNGEIVATASARLLPQMYPNAGYVHYVAASPDHAGKKLGFWVSLATLYQFVRLGCVSAVLDTDDFRLPAVKTYLNLGFVPHHTDDTHATRWAAVEGDLAARDAPTQNA